MIFYFEIDGEYGQAETSNDSGNKRETEDSTEGLF